jgi:hypothetical protein
MKTHDLFFNGNAAARSCRRAGAAAAKLTLSSEKRQKKHGMPFAIDHGDIHLSHSTHPEPKVSQGKP